MIAEMIRAMRDAGVPAEQILTAVESYGDRVAEAAPKQSPAAVRQARYRRKKSPETVTSITRDVTHNEVTPPSFLPSLSPTPPILTNQSPPPIVPPALPKPAVVASATDDGFEPAWKALTDKMRKRSVGKEQTQRLWRLACQRVDGSARLTAALKRYLANDDDCRRTGGPGFHKWLKDARYEAWLAEPDTPNAQGPPAPEVAAYRLRHYRDTREWRPEWGERPSEAA